MASAGSCPCGGATCRSGVTGATSGAPDAPTTGATAGRGWISVRDSGITDVGGTAKAWVACTGGTGGRTWMTSVTSPPWA